MAQATANSSNQRQSSGTDARTGKKISPDYANWTTRPNNPMAKVAAE